MKENITKSSGNVFADLGFAEQEAANLKVRAELMATLETWIHDNRLKQKDAARLFKINQSRVSDLVNGKIDKFSIDTLVNMLALTDQTVEINIRVA